MSNRRNRSWFVSFERGSIRDTEGFEGFDGISDCPGRASIYGASLSGGGEAEYMDSIEVSVVERLRSIATES